MHIEITYGDGDTERVPVTLGANRVASGQSWIPGHDVSEPSRRATVASDFFCAALDEGRERSGSYDPSDDEEAFSWRLVGTERDHCLDLLRQWSERMGAEPFRDPGLADHDPDFAARQAASVGLSEVDARRFADDVEVIRFYVDDVRSLVDEVVAEATPSPLTGV